jgi:hypothetical protein
MTRSITHCVFVPSLEKFKIISLKGKICSSGFGVSSATGKRQNNSDDVHAVASPENSTGHYLFIEEVLYLHERGVLEAYSEQIITGASNAESSSQYKKKSTDQQRALLSTSNLYELMLHTFKVPLAVYLTYSHLRSQTYIALRHTTRSFELLKLVKEEEEMMHLNKIRRKENGLKDSNITSNQSDGDKNVKRAKLLLRQDQFHASTPLVFRSNHTTEDSDTTVSKSITLENFIAFDVYNPNGNFRKTNPGLPDFCVAIACFNEESAKMNILRELVKTCGHIPLKICAVSDGGSIAMFGVSTNEVPCIN